MPDRIVDFVNGDDAAGNPGTSELSPWKTIQRAVGIGGTGAQPGETIRYRGGTHPTSGGAFFSQVSGSSGLPIIHTRYGTEPAVWDLSGGNFWVPSGHSDIQFKFLEITAGTMGHNSEPTSEVFRLLWEDCYLHGLGNGTGVDNLELVEVTRCVDYVIRRCRFEDVSAASSSTNAAGVKCYSGYNGLIEYCTFKNIESCGFQQKHGHPSNPAIAVEIRYCTFDDCRHEGGVVLAPTGTQSPIFGVNCHHNLFTRCKALKTLSTDTNAQATTLTFDHNTIILTGARGFISRGYNQMNVHSNIFYSAVSPGLAISTDMGGGALWQNGFVVLDRNCYFQIANDFSSGPEGGFERDRDGATDANYDGLAAWQAASSTASTVFPANHEANSITSNPLFAETTTYTLQAGSPCRGTGLDGTDMGWTSAVAASAARAYALPGKSRRRVFAF